MIETWLPVIGYEGEYEVSDLGRVASLKTHGRMVLKQQLVARYMTVGLWKGGKPKRHKVHRLVLEAFEGQCPPGLEALHGPEGRLCNWRSNLRWGTKSENMREYHAANPVEVCVNGHNFTERNTYRRPDGKGRACRQCMLDRNRRRKGVKTHRGLYGGKGQSYVA